MTSSTRRADLRSSARPGTLYRTASIATHAQPVEEPARRVSRTGESTVLARTRHRISDFVTTALCACAWAAAAGCSEPPPSNSVRASGYVEADEVRAAAEVGGRVLELRVKEGDRVKAGDVIAVLDVQDVDLAIRRAEAEREQAKAQLALVQAGARPEEIQQAEAQAASAEADVAAAQAELKSASDDLRRFEALLETRAGSRKQRDDAATREEVARARVKAAVDRVQAARAAVARLRRWTRREEVDAARARIDAADAQVASLQKNRNDAEVRSGAGGIVSEKLINPGEIAAPRAPLVVIVDLDHVWANVYVDEPVVPRLALNQSVTVFNDAGGSGLPGRVRFISPSAEFTPRNVQTAAERSKLVYRVEIAVDNSGGVLKQGMPVEAEIPLQPVK